MIFTKNSIYTLPVEAIVNIIDCNGHFEVNKSGFAIKANFPMNYMRVKETGENGLIKVNKAMPLIENNTLVINLPLREKFETVVTLNDVKTALEVIKKVVLEENVQSIAIPPLGIEDLAWEDIKKAIEVEFGLSGRKVYVIKPRGSEC